MMTMIDVDMDALRESVTTSFMSERLFQLEFLWTH